MKRKRNHIQIYILLLVTIIGPFFISPVVGRCIALEKDSSNEQQVLAHCILTKERETITVKEDGTFLDRDEVFIKILDEKGKRQQQVQRFYMNRNYGSLSIKRFELIKGNGQIVPVDWKKNSKETTPAAVSRMNIYDPNQKVISVFIPGLHVGDTIHYVSEVATFKPIIKGHFFGRAILQQTFPVRSIDLTITLPRNKAFFHLIKGKESGAKVNLERKLQGNLQIYHWHFQDIPQLVPEPDMPEVSRVAMRLLFSTLESWQEVSRWYYDLVEPKLKVNDAIISTVQRLIQGKKDDLEREEAIFYFVSRQIRYMGLIEESKRPGYEPHAVTLTFSRGYGVCRDKAALLVAMLRVAGFNAVPVLVLAGGKLDPEIPVPYFNHAIAAIMGKNGRPLLYMDPTSETSRQFLPDYEQDSSCLPATKQGSTLLLTPVQDPSKNLFSMHIAEVINKDGNLSGTMEIRTANFIDTAFRSILMPRSYQEQVRFLKGFILKRWPDLRIIHLSWTNLSEVSQPFMVKCKFEIKDFLKKQGLFYPLSLTNSLGLIDSWVLSKASMVKRRYPLRLKYTFKTLVTEEIKLDFKYNELMLPKTINITNKFFSYGTSLTIIPGGIKIKRHFINKALELPRKRYKDLLEIQSDLNLLSITPFIIN